MTDNTIPIDLAKSDESRAVSPVIGVILMVAITIILAAVIGAFVLGFGGQDSAPAASWTTEQTPNPAVVNDDDDELTDGLEVTIEHNGGDRVSADSVSIQLPDSDASADDVDIDDLTAGSTVTIDFDNDDVEADDDDDGNGLKFGDGQNIEDGDRVQLLWESGDRTQVLATHALNIDDGDSGE